MVNLKQQRRTNGKIRKNRRGKIHHGVNSVGALVVRAIPQSAQRVARANFWRLFHNDGKISPAWWEWGWTPTPFHYSISSITYKIVVYALGERADTLLLLYPCMYSVGYNVTKPTLFELCQRGKRFLKIGLPNLGGGGGGGGACIFIMRGGDCFFLRF